LEAEQLSTLAAGEKKEYQAEVKQLMHLIINSIYSNVEVFLRELISNGSDALDKIRILSLSNRSIIGENEELGIRIRADLDRKELHIIDNGVGMTKKELVTNLGTIAKSGTKDFAKAAAEGDAQSLIGQFGVGFYSAFLVADRVTVVSKSYLPDEPQHVWHSDAAQNFVVAVDPRGITLGHGTHITLHFKDSQLELLKEDKLKELIGKYSEFISFPIRLWTTRNETEDVPLTTEELEEQKAQAAKKEEEKKEEEAKKEDEEIKSEDEKAKEEEKKEELPTTKSVTKTVHEWLHVNSKLPIWTRSASEITKEEYNEFYKHISKVFFFSFFLSVF
jgi:heat shock protein beta